MFSGGPASVHVDDAPTIDPAVYDAGVPVLGICYGAQLVAQQLGGEVRRTGGGEYGRTPMKRTDAGSVVLAELAPEQVVWMSHGDAITSAPPGFAVTARSPGAPIAALEDRDRRVYGVQFHPEVAHTERGQDVMRAFLFDVCGCRPTWTNTSIIEDAVDEIRGQVGDERVICGLSGGVDSAVAAALVHKAVGDQLTCVFVDTGLLRLGEAGPGGGDVPGPVPRRPRPREGGRPLSRRARTTSSSPSASARSSERRSSGCSRRSRATCRTPASSCRARSIPTSSSPAVVTTRRSSRTTMSAGFPTT